MIHVEKKPEPSTFNNEVRQKGIQWLKNKDLPLTGPIPGGIKLPAYWRKCLDDLHTIYGGVCAYVSVYIEKVVGAASVDHFIAKSGDIGQAYEWGNYRLACSRMNSRKLDFDDVLDPFEIDDDLFRLDLVTGKIYPNNNVPDSTKNDVQKTIDRLGLDDSDCRKLRATYFSYYLNGDISERHLKRVFPFVWKEASRQGVLK